MKYFTITIPVKAYVRKYIEARYPQPITLTLHNYIGCVIYSYLNKANNPLILQNKQSALITRVNKQDDSIKVLIPKYRVHSSHIGLNIEPADAVLIYKLFREKLIEDLHTWCIAYESSVSPHINKNHPYRQAIETFCKRHNIILEVDIPYDTIRRAEYRHRKSLNNYAKILSTPSFREQFSEVS